MKKRESKNFLNILTDNFFSVTEFGKKFKSDILKFLFIYFNHLLLFKIFNNYNFKLIVEPI